MSPQILFFYLSGIVGFFGSLPYIWYIYRGGVKPHRVSWLIWGVLSAINFFSQYSLGARNSLIFTGTTAIFCLAVFVISLRKGVGGYSKLDIFCLISASVGLVLWWYTGNAITSLIINICIDAIGVVPTIRKLWIAPHSESMSAFVAGGISAALSILSEPSFVLSHVIFLICVVIANTSIITVSLYRSSRLKSA